MRIVACILGLLLLPVLYTTSTIFAQNEQKTQKMTDQDCSDSAKDCKPKVCWAGDKGDCSCFTCEYGEVTAHVVCTKDKHDKKALFDYARENKERCPSLKTAPLPVK